MALGLGALGLSPHVFWMLTLPELNAAIAGRFGKAPDMTDAPSRLDLDDMMRRFPDVEMCE